MRPLPPGLAALISTLSQQPLVTVTAQDQRMRLSQLSAGGPGGRSAALITSAGTILRVCVPQNPDPNAVIVQRITSALTPSQWSAAGVTIAANAAAKAGCAVVQTGALIRIFYQSSTDQKLYFLDSTDDGQTWSAPAGMGIALPLGTGNSCYGIAASQTTNVVAAYATADSNACLWVQSSYMAGWSAWANTGPTSPGWGKIRGICCAQGTQSYIAGVQMKNQQTGIAAATTFTTSGSDWHPFTQVLAMDNGGLGLQLANPSLHWDAGASIYYATITYTDDGSQSAFPNTRTVVSTSPDLVTWSPLVQCGQVFQYGAHALKLGGRVFIFDGSVCFLLTLPSPQIDLSADVLALAVVERPNQPARMTLTLSNVNQAYFNNAALDLDATLQVSIGYGSSQVLTHTMIVESLTATATATLAEVTVTARDHCKLLDYPSTKLLIYNSKTIAQLVQAVCREAGATLAALPATSQFGQIVPCFQITPGETWLTAIDRLATTYDFTYFADETPQIRVVEKAGTDPSTWTYAADIMGAQWTQDSDQPNWIRVIGAPSTGTNVPPYADVLDQPNITAVAAHRQQLLIDRMLTTSAQCWIKAQLLLAAAQREAVAGTIHAAMNPQLQLSDVITLNEPWIGLTAQPMRIAGLDLLIHPESGQWFHTIHTTGV